MGTRSLTIFKQGDGEEIAVMYRQFDGYLSGHGQDLADFLQGKKLVNGIRGDADESKIFNGMGCLAARTVAHFIEAQEGRAGGIYLHSAGTRDCGEEYLYTISNDSEGWNPKGPLQLLVECVYGDSPVIYEGPMDGFDPKELEKEEE